MRHFRIFAEVAGRLNPFPRPFLVGFLGDATKAWSDLPKIAGVLALDALACIEAITASGIAGVPYTGLREAMRFSDAQKAEIAEAVQKIAANHAAAFAAHKDAIELGVALTAMQAAQLDQVLLLAADKEPLSWQQVLGSLAIIFAPLALLLVLDWLRQLQAGV